MTHSNQVTKEAPRINMTLGQLYTNDIHSPELLQVLASIPRESFVPDQFRGCAYVDEDLPLGHNRYILAPLVSARMMMEADIRKTDKVLVLGCGLGYSVAVASRLAGEVIGCDTLADVAYKAHQSLAAFGAENARTVQIESLAKGYPKEGPYDVILIEGAIEQLPDIFTHELTEGGRLVTVLQSAARPNSISGLGRIVRYTKHNGALQLHESFEANVPVLTDFLTPKPFIL